ncbi:MAG: transcription factor S [Candidatus Thermoplasmatota archaeon]
MAFCGACKSLVYPVGGKLACKKCGWSSDGPAASNMVRSAAEGSARVVLEKKEEVRPLQTTTCPKCAHDRAYFHLMQTRRSDEPPTQINECEKCHHSWRDYG